MTTEMSIRRDSPSPRPARGAFTLVEMMMSLFIGSVVVGAALAGIVSLQRSYAATEQYASNLADQTRLLDCLGMDLRRARAIAFDADGNGMMVTLPDFYNYQAADTIHAAPLPNLPQVPTDHSRAVYTTQGNDPNLYPQLPTASVYYHFDAGTKNVTREELPPAANGPKPTNLPPASANSVFGVRTLASSLLGFPQIQLLDASKQPLGSPNSNPAAGLIPIQASITVCFKPTFSTVSTPDTNLIRLHGRVYLRNNDLRIQ